MTFAKLIRWVREWDYLVLGASEYESDGFWYEDEGVVVGSKNSRNILKLITRNKCLRSKS